MFALRIAFPWILLTASLAVNLYLWRTNPSDLSHPSHKSYSKSPSPSAPTTNYPPLTTSSHIPPSQDPAPTSSPSLNSQPSTLHSTSTRSSAFRNYADLLAEELQTPEQLAALHQLLARWVATSPADAATWLAQHDDAPFYDPAALHVAKHLVAHEHFSEASSWADLIRDPALREDALDSIVAESFRAKKIDATAVHASGLPSERIAAILNGSRLD